MGDGAHQAIKVAILIYGSGLVLVLYTIATRWILSEWRRSVGEGLTATAVFCGGVTVILVLTLWVSCIVREERAGREQRETVTKQTSQCCHLGEEEETHK